MYIVHFWTLWQKFDSLEELKKWLEVSGNRNGIKAIYKIESKVSLEDIYNA